MEQYDIYQDIATRTGGDIYLGVVGPVRTGKSTFIKKFMETLVLPNIEDKHRRQRVIDELPQSADGKTIMTTQPKFVPDDGVKVVFGENLSMNVRLIDCVGYIVDNAQGYKEGEKSRLVRTPWSDDEMPFEQAAELGTHKVICDHSTIGVLMTTDGSITDIARADYVSGEERVVNELKELGKPFVIIINSMHPNHDETVKLREALSEKYGVAVLAKNVLEMTADDIEEILKSVLLEFPVKNVDIDMPKWMQGLPLDNFIIRTIADEALRVSKTIEKMADYECIEHMFKDSEIVDKIVDVRVDFGTGNISVQLIPNPSLFYKVLSDQCGMDIDDDFKLIAYMKELSVAEKYYRKMKDALAEVEARGYGIVNPTMEEMTLQEPQIVKKGGKFGVRLKASAPSLHIMKIDVETEINPIMGTEEQSSQMLNYLNSEVENNPNGLWETNMFGKSLNVLVREGLESKLNSIPADTEAKMRKTLGRIVNEGKGGVLCVLL